jgi:hypothetical protein
MKRASFLKDPRIGRDRLVFNDDEYFSLHEKVALVTLPSVREGGG